MSDVEVAGWQETVTLPVGYEDEETGTALHELSVRKLTGNEEALLVEPKLRQNGGKLVTALLASCVRDADTGAKLPPATIRRLTSADRNYLLLELRRVTFGDELEARYHCPRCGESTLVLEDLGELDVRRVEDGAELEIVVELEDGYRDRDGTVHRELVFGLPIGEDEEAAASRRDGNASRQRDALLARCLRRVGDLEPRRVEALGSRVLSDLTMSDRRRIQQAMDDAAPGPNLIRTVSCDRCLEEFRALLDMSRFFPIA
jgi:hypothetical protein